MKLSLQWIKEFTDVDMSNDELVARVGAQIGAIEDVEDWSSYYSEDIIIAEITSAADHPDADKLGVYEVKISETETRNLVAGDKTLKVGDRVGYIQPGATVPLSAKEGDPFVISQRDIRGKTSQGMLGSAKELLLSDNHDGVAKLDTDVEIGTPFAEAYKLNDLIIDIENKMFTHRPDLFGILGLAREVAGIQQKQFSSPEWYVSPQDLAGVENELPLGVINEIPDACERFTAVVMDGVEVGQSNYMMQSMLFRVGLRPINSVVDASNYAMYLTAQPSHAFDYDKVAEASNADGAQIVVRNAKKNEKLTLLDGREINLTETDMVIATDSKVISLAGVMGGAETEVSADTKRIILEVATWDLYAIRRTSYQHGIFSDAVTRYNKGQSGLQCKTVLTYVAQLLSDTSQASVASAIYDDNHAQNYDDIELDADFVNLRLGSQFSADEIAQILQNVEISGNTQNAKVRVAVPFWRTDLEYKEDLVEEVGRLYGYDNLPVVVPKRLSFPNMRSGELVLKDTIRTIMASAGAQEVWTYNFVSSALLKKAGLSDSDIEMAYKIRNSISPELEYMRINILPSITSKVSQNVRLGYDTVALFEVNKSHSKEFVADGIPEERTSLAFTITRKTTSNNSAYFEAKKYAENVLSRLGVAYEIVPIDTDGDSAWSRGILANLAKTRSSAVTVEGKVVGYIGEYNARAKRAFKLESYSAGFEIDIANLFGGSNIYQPLSKFPKLTQDITLETPDETSYSELIDTISKAADESGILQNIEPFSIYRPKDAKRRISLRCTFNSKDRTLSTKEVNELIAHIVRVLNEASINQI